MPIVTKSPAEVKDYGRDFTKWLEGDTIQSSAWTVPEGLVKQSEGHTETTATVVISGGVLDHDYELVVQIETAGGLIAQETIDVQVREP